MAPSFFLSWFLLSYYSPLTLPFPPHCPSFFNLFSFLPTSWSLLFCTLVAPFFPHLLALPSFSPSLLSVHPLYRCGAGKALRLISQKTARHLGVRSETESWLHQLIPMELRANCSTSLVGLKVCKVAFSELSVTIPYPFQAHTGEERRRPFPTGSTEPPVTSVIFPSNLLILPHPHLTGHHCHSGGHQTLSPHLCCPSILSTALLLPSSPPTFSTLFQASPHGRALLCRYWGACMTLSHANPQDLGWSQWQKAPAPLSAFW